MRNKIEKLFSRIFKRAQTIIDSTSDKEIIEEIEDKWPYLVAVFLLVVIALGYSYYSKISLPKEIAKK